MRLLKASRLSATTVRGCLDALIRVKKMIDDMIALFRKEKENEIKFNDFCVDDLTFLREA